MATPLSAGICTVPGTHGTIQAAIVDPSCTSVDLANQTYAESVLIPRSLTLAGPPGGMATIQGLVVVEGTSTLAALSELGIENGCGPEAVLSRGGAELAGTRLAVTRSLTLPCPVLEWIFGDGFESGDTSAWPGSLP